jgi:hypothetical protein
VVLRRPLVIEPRTSTTPTLNRALQSGADAQRGPVRMLALHSMRGERILGVVECPLVVAAQSIRPIMVTVTRSSCLVHWDGKRDFKRKARLLLHGRCEDTFPP